MAPETQRDLSIPSASSSASPIASFNPFATQVSPMSMPLSRALPLGLDRGQAYYWSQAWQSGEQETRAALAAGLGVSFSNAEEAIRWLLSDDDPPNAL